MTKLQREKLSDSLRMSDWLLSAFAWFAVNFFAESLGIPATIRDLSWKLGIVSLSGYMGFRLDRRLFGKYDDVTATEGRKVCRALVVGSFLLAVSLAL